MSDPTLPDSLLCGRPIPDAMASVEAVANKISSLLSRWEAEGEVCVVLDVLQWKSVLTMHVPLPSNKS